MPGNVLRAILEDKRAVWPVVGFEVVDAALHVSDASATGKREFAQIPDVLVSSATAEDVDDATVAALVMAGVRMTRPPGYITDLLRQEAQYRRLTPESAHQWLLVSSCRSYTFSFTDPRSFLDRNEQANRPPYIPLSTSEHPLLPHFLQRCQQARRSPSRPSRKRTIRSPR